MSKFQAFKAMITHLTVIIAHIGYLDISFLSKVI